MKTTPKYIIIAMFFGVMAVLANITFAEEISPVSTSSVEKYFIERQIRIQERKDAFRAELNQKVFLSKQATPETFISIDQDTKEVLATSIQKIFNRFTLALDRLDNITDRLESRIEKVETEGGVSYTSLRATVENTRISIDQARGISGASKEKITEMLSEEKIDVELIKQIATEAKEAIKNSRNNLVYALNLFKGNSISETEEENSSEPDEKLPE